MNVADVISQVNKFSAKVGFNVIKGTEVIGNAEILCEAMGINYDGVFPVIYFSDGYSHFEIYQECRNVDLTYSDEHIERYKMMFDGMIIYVRVEKD